MSLIRCSYIVGRLVVGSQSRRILLQRYATARRCAPTMAMGPGGPVEAKYGGRFGSAQGGVQCRAMPWHPSAAGRSRGRGDAFQSSPGFIHCPPRGAAGFASVPLLPRPGSRRGREHAGGRGYSLQVQGSRPREAPGARSPGGDGGGADGPVAPTPILLKAGAHILPWQFAASGAQVRPAAYVPRRCLHAGWLAAAALWRAAKHHVSCQGGARLGQGSRAFFGRAGVPVAHAAAGVVSLRRSRSEARSTYLRKR